MGRQSYGSPMGRVWEMTLARGSVRLDPQTRPVDGTAIYADQFGQGCVSGAAVLFHWSSY